MEFKKNEVFQVRIEDMSSEGEGIGKTDGFAWFIKDTVTGDLVEASVMKTKKSYGFARLIRQRACSAFVRFFGAGAVPRAAAFFSSRR